MIAESKLNWSYEKPTFEEVKEKVVFTINDMGVHSGWKILSLSDYELIFESESIKCYAIIADPEPEPMELWGFEVEVKQIGDNYWVEYGDINKPELYLQSPVRHTRSEAILAWNKIAEALNKIERVK